MSTHEKLQKALEYATEHKPPVDSFPFLAECLRLAGVKHNLWSLPGVTSMYLMDTGEYILNQGVPLMTGFTSVPPFDSEGVVAALRRDQAEEISFEEFLTAIWNAGVWSYDVNFEKRTVMYMGTKGEQYSESYPAVLVDGLSFE